MFPFSRFFLMILLEQSCFATHACIHADAHTHAHRHTHRHTHTLTHTHTRARARRESGTLEYMHNCRNQYERRIPYDTDNHDSVQITGNTLSTESIVTRVNDVAPTERRLSLAVLLHKTCDSQFNRELRMKTLRTFAERLAVLPFNTWLGSSTLELS